MTFNHRALGIHTAALTLFMVGALPVVAAAQSGGRSGENAVAALVSEAEAAFGREDAVAAKRAYRAVLTLDPSQPRALFRLAQLCGREDPEGATALLQQYVRVVPSDAWGHLALADVWARRGDAHRALEAYEDAVAREPADRDIQLGRPRLLDRLGQTDRAISAYESWLVGHPADGEIWRELAGVRQRAGRIRGATQALERAREFAPADPSLLNRIGALRLRAAPTAQFGFLGSGDTDVQTTGMSFAVDAPAGDSGRVGAVYQRRQVASFGDSANTQRLVLQANTRPRSDIQLTVSGGAVWSARSDGSGLRPDAALRIRRAAPRNGPTVDVRLRRDAIEATPELVRAPVSRTQVVVSSDVPVGGPWMVRGQALIARLTRQGEDNRRTGVAAGMGVAVAPEFRLVAQWQQVRNSNPGARGYFAPDKVEVADVGVDFEREYDRGSIAVDAGGGIQRFRRTQQSVMGSWEPALRIWGLAAWKIGLRQQLLIEFETYDSRLADAAVGAQRWRYASVTTSLRLALR
jgi:tetratricopeptide (TPR) repeat protein